MKRRNIGRWLGLAGSCAWLLAGCASHEGGSEEATGTSEDALTRGSGLTLPAPIGSPSPWKASELLFADALGTCTAAPGDPDGAPERGTDLADGALYAVRAKMRATITAQQGPNAPATWRALRADSTRNEAAFSKAKVSVPLTKQYPARYEIRSVPYLGSDIPELQAAFNAAGVNLCMARAIYEQTRFESTLLTTALEKTAMLETARERAQLAMLSLTSILTTAGASTAGIPDDSLERSVWLLRQWAETAAGQPAGGVERQRLDGLLQDLQDAARLEVLVTEELARLLHRHASARLPLPTGDTLPSDNFGAGGWRERLVALLYGGDPLASASPGAPAPLVTDGADKLRWPTREERPSAPDGKWSGEVVRFFALARALDALDVDLVGADYTSGKSIQLEGSAALFRRIEAALRTNACLSYDAKVRKCLPVTAESLPDPSTALAEYEIYKRHGLKVEHARALLDALADALPTTTGAGLHLLGGFRITPSSSSDSGTLHIDGDAQLLPRSLVEAAGVYGRMGRVHWREVLGTTSITSVFPTRSLLTGSDAPRAEGARRMGALSALAAVRDAVGSVPDTNVGRYVASALSGTSASFTAFLESAAGRSVVSIRPVEGSSPTPSGVVLAQQVAPNGDPLWRVRVRPTAGDSFWEGRLDELSVFATEDVGSALTRLFDPSHDKPEGFVTLATSAATAQGAGRRATMTRRPDGAMDALLPIPSAKAAVVIAVRRPRGRAPEYRLVAGPVRLWVGRHVQGGVSVPVAVDSYFGASGGRLEQYALDALTPSQWDPAKPAFDGFGQPIGAVPDRSVQLTEDKPSLFEYTAAKLALAQEDALSAERSLQGALDLLEKQDQGTLDIALAKERALVEERAAIRALCGVPGDGSDRAAPVETQVARACGLKTVRSDALGNQPLPAGTCATGPVVEPASAPASEIACDPRGTPAQVLRCGLDSLVPKMNFPVELSAPVACAGSSGAVGLPANLTGELAELVVAQSEALRTYRSRVRELFLAGDAVLAGLEAAQARIAVTEAEKRTVEARRNAAQRIANENLQRAVADLETAKERDRAANDYAQKLGISSPKEAGQAVARGLMGAGQGASLAITVGTAAAAAAAIPGPGWIVGGIGALVGLFASIGGPSDEEISKAQSDVKAAQLDVKHKSDELGRVAQQARCFNQPNDAKCLKDSEAAVFSAELLTREANEAAERAAATSAYREALLRLHERLSAAQSAASDLVLSKVRIDNALRRATLAIEQARFEASFVTSRANGLFGIAQGYHGASLRTAVGAANRAAGTTLDALRAVEFVLGRSLTEETATSTKFAAPRLWAGDVFTDDLSVLRYVGPTPTTGVEGVMQDRAPQYLRNLQVVSSGLLDAVGLETKRDGALVINLSGPAAEAEVNGEAVPHPFAYQWQFLCPATSTCAPQGGWCGALRTTKPREACVTSTGASLKPEQARITVQLDARGTVRNDPLAVSSGVQSGLGARWIRMLANVAEGLPGQREESVPVSIRAVGPFIVSDETGKERVLPLATYDTGRFLAKMTGDVYRSGDDALRSHPDRVRTDLLGLPVAGTYELTFYARDPERVANAAPLDLTKLQTFQLVFDRFYTTKR